MLVGPFSKGFQRNYLIDEMKNSNKKQRTSYQDGLEKRRVELLQQRDRLPVNLGMVKK